MENIENAVAQHYGAEDLLERILAGLKAVGADLENLRPDTLSPVDEFHIGGRNATAHAVAKMALNGDSHVLDIGCGIGGTARYLAAQTGCAVTGVDLTPEYVSVAEKLTDLTRLGERVRFETASALDMPFDDESFDAAITIHVAMNIPDRAALYGEIARVLKPGATLCIYDVMKKNDESLAFPLPWAQSAETSHLSTPDETVAHLREAGFDIADVDDRTEAAIDFFKQAAAARSDEPPPLGTHILMGASAPEKLKNVFGNIQAGRIAPVQVIATRKPN